MSLENKLTSCPLCNCTLNDTANRLIKEFCGHLKCRVCLLNETNGCQLCYELTKNRPDRINSIDSNVPLPEDQSIVYRHVTEISVGSDYDESGSDKLQIDTDLESLQDDNINSKSKSNLANSKKFNSKRKNIKTSRRGTSLYAHILTKSNDEGRYFECSLCTKTFTSRGHRHYHLFCNNIEKPLKCDKCGKEFITKFHYNYHLETHQKNTTFKCPKCDRSYLRSNSLRKHLQKHSMLKNFSCSDCGAKFQSSSLLKLHENTHKNIYPFECDKCDRKFTLKSNLQNHLVVHLNEKRFDCKLCGKKFARKGALKLHSSSHSEERPYECKYCKKTFTHQWIYSRHIRIHLGNKTFNCPFCDAKCSRKDNFYRHLRNLHPNSNYKEHNKDLIESNYKLSKDGEAKEMETILNYEKKNLGEDNLDTRLDIPVDDLENTNEVESLPNLNTIRSDGPNSVNVIQSVGNVIPIKIASIVNSTDTDDDKVQDVISPPIVLPEYRSEIAKEICQITNQINSTPIKRTMNGNKSKKPYDPIEIYRKILMPNENDEEESDEIEKSSNINDHNQINEKEQDITKEILKKPPPIDFSEVHWRKRTSQYFAMK